MAAYLRYNILAIHLENRRVMKPIYSAVHQGGVLVGGFARVTGIDLADGVDALKQRLKIWSAELGRGT